MSERVYKIIWEGLKKEKSAINFIIRERYREMVGEVQRHDTNVSKDRVKLFGSSPNLSNPML